MVNSSLVSSIKRTLNRREFLTLSGTTVALTYWSLSAHGQAPGSQTSTGSSPIGPPGEAKQRIDGLRKVTGEKIFARDFHAWDIPGWPSDPKAQAELLVIRPPTRIGPFSVSIYPCLTRLSNRIASLPGVSCKGTSSPRNRWSAAMSI